MDVLFPAYVHSSRYRTILRVVRELHTLVCGLRRGFIVGIRKNDADGTMLGQGVSSLSTDPTAWNSMLLFATKAWGVGYSLLTCPYNERYA